MHTRRSLNSLKTISYILAGLVLALGLIAGISLIASAANVNNVLLPLQLMGADAIANLIAPLLTRLISGLGVVAIIVSLVLSLLLFAAGRLLGHIASLEARLARLEAQKEPALFEAGLRHNLATQFFGERTENEQGKQIPKLRQKQGEIK